METLAEHFPEPRFPPGAYPAGHGFAGNLRRWCGSYLRLHRDDLTPRDRWWLKTQLQEHIAAPCTCLVVVLIAIPFGPAPGRRNVFAGVASGTVICFGYFILLRLGLALGSGGLLPPWVAAWLPNASFAAAGLWLLRRAD
jgi:lipopolysaccharide export system permease protein